jgi:carbonic anhydrase
MGKKYCLIVFLWLSSALWAILPEEALNELKTGNERFVSGKSEHPHQLPKDREALLKGQTPFAIVISCSDSRVPPEIVFDQGLGDLFVIRIAGNVVGPLEMDSVEFAAERLGASLILVLGHENCSAVNGVLLGQIASNYITNTAPYIEPAVKASKKMTGNRLANATKLNIKNVVKQLGSSRVLSNLLKAKKLKITGGYYYLKDGKVEYLQAR